MSRAGTAAGNRPVIVKKVRKVAGHGHHGGAWKVAYADFVTAMMAFFLLLWLLNVTTDEQRLGIANYFLPTTYSKGESGSVGLSGGDAVESDGPFNMTPMTTPGVITGLPIEDGEGSTDRADGTGKNPEEQRQEFLEQMQQEEFERVRDALREAVQENEELAELARNLLIDRTPEGVRIQILDQDQRSMFPLGSAAMYPFMQGLMAKIVEVIEPTGRRVTVTGHTDATPFRDTSSRDNWQLSADRANAARRAMVEGGLDPTRIDRVAGKADTEPLYPDDPEAPANRRISIVLLYPPDDPELALTGE